MEEEEEEEEGSFSSETRGNSPLRLRLETIDGGVSPVFDMSA